MDEDEHVMMICSTAEDPIRWESKEINKKKPGMTVACALACATDFLSTSCSFPLHREPLCPDILLLHLELQEIPENNPQAR